MNSVEMQGFCDKISEEYVDFLQSPIDSEEYRIVLETIKKEDRIIDVGSGTGRYIIPLSEMGYKMEGIDYSEGMIKQARKIAHKHKVKIKITHADACAIPKKNDSYDTVLFLGDGLGFIPSKHKRRTSIRECNRIMKDRGRFILVVTDRNHTLLTWFEHLIAFVLQLHDRSFIYGDRYWNFGGHRAKHHDFSKNEIEYELHSCGFEVIECIKEHDKFIYVCTKDEGLIE